jgi:aspartyl-tRNA(Asn)/glutamyl-tRNA(Gln) amidotransferase subunit C
MKLSIEEVQHIAHLARLELSSEEIQRYQGQLSSILDYIAMLQELDTSSVPPTSSVLPFSAPLRDDLSRQGLSTAKALQNAPSQEQNQFKVPPVLDES